MTYYRFGTRLTRRVPLVEQELTTLPEHLSSPPFLVGFVLLDLLLIIIQRLNGKEITLDIVVKYIASFFL
jgi:hypothetical protein